MDKLVVKRGRIKAHVNVPGIVLDLNVPESVSALKEIRKMIELIRQDSIEYDPFGVQFSDELRSSPAAMEFIKQATRAEQGMLYRKLAVENVRVVDADRKECFSTLGPEKIKQTLNTGLADIPSTNASLGLVHVMSTISKDDKALLVDALKKRMPRVDFKTQFTHKDVLGKTVVELLLFGTFDEEY